MINSQKRWGLPASPSVSFYITPLVAILSFEPQTLSRSRLFQSSITFLFHSCLCLCVFFAKVRYQKRACALYLLVRAAFTCMCFFFFFSRTDSRTDQRKCRMGVWLCVTVGREANLISPGGFTRRWEERTTLCVQLFSFVTKQLFSFRCFLKEEVKLCDVVSGLKIYWAFDWSTKVCFLFFCFIEAVRAYCQKGWSILL